DRRCWISLSVGYSRHLLHQITIIIICSCLPVSPYSPKNMSYITMPSEVLYMERSMESPHRIPPGIVSPADYETTALQRLPEDVAAWLSGGSADEVTLRRNRLAFERVGLRSRVCQVPSAIDTRCELLGQTLAHPILLAPV